MSTTSALAPTPAPRAADHPTERPVHRTRAALHAEWIKLRSLRSTRGVLALSVATGAALVAGLTRAAPDTAPTIADGLGFPVVFAAVFAAVAGISLFTGEVQHHTLDAALVAQPARTVIATAKVVVATLLGAAIALVGQVGGLLAGLAVGADAGGLDTIAAQAGWATLFAAGAAAFGLGVGMVVRHGTGAITGLLVWWLVVENLVVALAPARFARLLPFVAGNGMVGIEMDSPDAAAADLLLSRPENTALLATYVVIALTAGLVALHRHEQS